MLQPLRAVAAAHPEIGDRLEIYQRRLDQQIAVAPPCEDDQLTARAIEGLARRSENGHDSVHQLVMDLQWELNRLNKAMSPESVDGAPGLWPGGRGSNDRAGVHARRQPDTGAEVRSGGARHVGDARQRSIDDSERSRQQRLHVFVVHVRELTATVIYTDIHRARIALPARSCRRSRHPVG